MEIRPNLLDWNVNELERKLELEDMKRTYVGCINDSTNKEFPHQCELKLKPTLVETVVVQPTLCED